MREPRALQLTVRTPSKTVVEEPVRGLTAEDGGGRFGLRPGGEPLIAALVPGVLIYQRPDGSEAFVALGRGVLDADRSTVTVAVREAFPCATLDQLEQAIERAARVRYEAESSLSDVYRSVYRDLLKALLDEERRA